MGMLLCHGIITRSRFSIGVIGSIKFDYLETIARKYIKSYYCKNIYICRKKELEKQKQKIKEKDENEKMKDEDKKRG